MKKRYKIYNYRRTDRALPSYYKLPIQCYYRLEDDLYIRVRIINTLDILEYMISLEDR